MNGPLCFKLSLVSESISSIKHFFCPHFRKQTDWGLRQLDSTRDVSNKGNSFFLVATTFGHHTLHHLFPTVDHSKLHLLYPILEETCKV